ncbi:MAG: N-acetylmuramoyl-L-alanine amidase, partial [Candidatus Cellulosilyticum pullistercoris]|nr:N-acetylmuramoyl-L-alanine amidase [Candidatus Cellulosilyticum pullistercoris]
MKRSKIIWLLVTVLSISSVLMNKPIRLQAAPGNVLTNKIIIVDPGHGGFDPGKPGITGLDEKDLNLKISLLLRNYLEQAGAIVIMTRTTDDDVDGMDGVKHKSKDMVQRKKLSEGGDILVSIHQNSFTQPSVHGAQTFYNS